MPPVAQTQPAASKDAKTVAETMAAVTAPAATPSPDAIMIAGNRFSALFGAVTFSAASDGAKTYTNERSGVKSRKIANVQIELGTTDTVLKGSIYARKSASAKKARAEFAWFGANMQTCILAQGAQAKAELLAFQSAIAKKYGEWLKANPAEANAAGAENETVELDGVNLD